MRLMIGSGLFTLDEMRRAIEELGPGAYEELSYYQRWIRAMTANLLRKGVVSEAELRARLEAGS